MDFKPLYSLDTQKDCLACEKRNLSSIHQELENSRLLIQQLKSDKKKLQEALRTVLNERNKKSEKLKALRQKYLQLENYLAKESDLIKEFHKEYQEFSKNRIIVKRPQTPSSQYRKEIQSLYEILSSHTKIFGLSIKNDDIALAEVKKAIKREKWDEAFYLYLQFNVKFIKKTEYAEEDTPQFIKPKAEHKIDLFLENSKALLQSLTEQQDRLHKLGKEYYQTGLKPSKHTKTTSHLPKPVRVLSHAQSTRSIKSSLGTDNIVPSGETTTKHSRKPSYELFSPTRSETRSKHTEE